VGSLVHGLVIASLFHAFFGLIFLLDLAILLVSGFGLLLRRAFFFSLLLTLSCFAILSGIFALSCVFITLTIIFIVFSNFSFSLFRSGFFISDFLIVVTSFDLSLSFLLIFLVLLTSCLIVVVAISSFSFGLLCLFFFLLQVTVLIFSFTIGNLLSFLFCLFLSLTFILIIFVSSSSFDVTIDHLFILLSSHFAALMLWVLFNLDYRLGGLDRRGMRCSLLAMSVGSSLNRHLHFHDSLWEYKLFNHCRFDNNRLRDRLGLGSACLSGCGGLLGRHGFLR